MGELRKYIGEEMAIVFWIPKNAKHMNINILCEDDDGGTFEVTTDVGENRIEEARQDYLLIDPDDCAFDLYTLAPEFKAFLEAGEKAGKDFDEINEEWDIYKDLILKEMY